jgi:hypothetical protein
MREVRHIDGITEYLLDRKHHRANGPAKIWQGRTWYWCLYGVNHRYYGPATTHQEWWIHGVFIKINGG